MASHSRASQNLERVCIGLDLPRSALSRSQNTRHKHDLEIRNNAHGDSCPLMPHSNAAAQLSPAGPAQQGDHVQPTKHGH